MVHKGFDIFIAIHCSLYIFFLVASGLLHHCYVILPRNRRAEMFFMCLNLLFFFFNLFIVLSSCTSPTVSFASLVPISLAFPISILVCCSEAKGGNQKGRTRAPFSERLVAEAWRLTFPKVKMHWLILYKRRIFVPAALWVFNGHCSLKLLNLVRGM